MAAFTSRNGRLAYLSSQKEISLGVKTNHPNSTEEMTGLGRHLSAKRVEALGIFKTQKVSKTLHNDTDVLQVRPTVSLQRRDADGTLLGWFWFQAPCYLANSSIPYLDKYKPLLHSFSR